MGTITVSGESQQLCGTLSYHPSRVTGRVLNASCLQPATSASNDHSSSLSPSVRRREKCRVFAHWPHVVCYPVSERQFCCRLCYEHSCRLNLNTSFHASPNSHARSIQRLLNHSRRTTQNPRISIPRVQITYRPLRGDWYVAYNVVGHECRSQSGQVSDRDIRRFCLTQRLQKQPKGTRLPIVRVLVLVYYECLANAISEGVTNRPRRY